jgi:hypothetical protein
MTIEGNVRRRRGLFASLREKVRREDEDEGGGAAKYHSQMTIEGNVRRERGLFAVHFRINLPSWSQIGTHLRA